MLLKKPFTIAHRAVMALDENALLSSTTAAHRHNTSRGKRARACGKNPSRLAERGKPAKKIAKVIERQRRPVCLNQRTIHAVRF